MKSEAASLYVSFDTKSRNETQLLPHKGYVSDKFIIYFITSLFNIFHPTMLYHKHISPSYSSQRDLHFLCNEGMDQFNQLIGTEKSKQSVWLVYVSFENRFYLKQMFKATPLRLDSEVYSIVKEGKGLYIDKSMIFQNQRCRLQPMEQYQLH